MTNYPDNVAQACPEHLAALLGAVDGELDVELRALLDVHLAGCSACRNALAVQVEACDVLRAWPALAASAGFPGRVMDAIDGALDTRGLWHERWNFKQWTWRLLPVTVALAVATYLVARTSIRVVDEANVDLPVAAVWLSDKANAADVLALMLYADPNDSLAHALEEISK